jgi:hypothetical protein
MVPVAFILTDQNFPPSLPVEGEGECLKIFRIEDAGLHELVTAFLEATRGFVVPAGSVSVLSSASYMAWVGAAAYSQEYMEARGRLRDAFRRGIEVIHGIPVLVNGFQNCAGVWAIQDTYKWLESISNSNLSRDITGTRGLFAKTFEGVESSGTPLAPPSEGGSTLLPPTEQVTPLAPVSYHLYMPANYDDRSMAVYEMSHIPSISFINPVNYRKCCELIDSLVIELNENFLTELGTVENPVKIGGNNADDST